MAPSAPSWAEPEGLKLNVGGIERRPGWTVVNIQPGPTVDVVADARDLSMFADGSVAALYASHILEHLSYQREVDAALAEWHRVLVPGGVVMVAVPNLGVLCQIYVHPEATAEHRHKLRRIIFGGQVDAFDVHKAGFDATSLGAHLTVAGFTGIERVADFGLFEDTSRLRLGEVPVSLNMRATKPRAG
ncbi:class I SAM-dependent methyltransferase [Roseospirillum parvum]|uniref:class I SAM-dependent methyltransferase n=1 Tax=Roseospirillum parvum TaxID=83401 RepID=UPI0015A43092|nr:methyltransferase domain-containing protein [Roseospirillum parvum]